jgi:hypothetical protein
MTSPTLSKSVHIREMHQNESAAQASSAKMRVAWRWAPGFQGKSISRSIRCRGGRRRSIAPSLARSANNLPLSTRTGEQIRQGKSPQGIVASGTCGFRICSAEGQIITSRSIDEAPDAICIQVLLRASLASHFRKAHWRGDFLGSFMKEMSRRFSN